MHALTAFSDDGCTGNYYLKNGSDDDLTDHGGASNDVISSLYCNYGDY